jgi:type IV pilus assembly protein PilM
LFGKSSLRIGIDIGSNSIKLVSYSPKGKPVLSRLSLIDLIKEEIVQRPEDITESHIMAGIKELLEGLPYKKASIRVCLSESINNLFVVDIHGVGEQELKQALFWELGPLLPKPVNNYEYDYQILQNDHKKKKITVLVGVYNKENLKRILKIFKNLGKSVDILETDTLSALDLFVSLSGNLKYSVALLQVGATHSNYTILTPDSHPNFLFIPFGGNRLNEIIAKNRGISFLSAEIFRRRNETTDDSISQDPDILDALQQFISTIVRFNIYHRIRTGKTPRKIYITGGLLADRFIYKAFRQSSDLFQAPCEFWDPVENYFPKEKIQPHHQYHFASALGLALR